MSGQHGIRGYLVQTVIGVLDALTTDLDWLTITLEPSGELEKADIVLRYSDRSVAKQVKSSVNQISASTARSWAADMASVTVADVKELILLGPTDASVVKLGTVNGVCVMPPKPLDIRGLVDQAAHRLDKYLEIQGMSPVPPFARELLVSALVGQFAEYSTSGREVFRSDFDTLLQGWLLQLYPQAVSDAVTMQCDVLGDTVILVIPPQQGSASLVLPLTFVNSGIRTAIIETVTLLVDHAGTTMFYRPLHLVALEGFFQGSHAGELHASNMKKPHFSEFALMPNVEKEMAIAFLQDPAHHTYPFAPWCGGEYRLRLFIGIRDREAPALAKTLLVKFSQADIESYLGGNRSITAMCHDMKKMPE